ncbi:MAG: hypothetical protein QM484_08410 [Woeseiaceae bacterium]
MARYKLVSIEKISPPDGATFQRWYKFIIKNDHNTITNLRAGSEKEIRKFASESIKRLNEKYLTYIKFKPHNPVYENNLPSQY